MPDISPVKPSPDHVIIMKMTKQLKKKPGKTKPIKISSAPQGKTRTNNRRKKQDKQFFNFLRGKVKITGDIVAPVIAEDEWNLD